MAAEPCCESLTSSSRSRGLTPPFRCAPPLLPFRDESSPWPRCQRSAAATTAPPSRTQPPPSSARPSLPRTSPSPSCVAAPRPPLRAQTHRLCSPSNNPLSLRRRPAIRRQVIPPEHALASACALARALPKFNAKSGKPGAEPAPPATVTAGFATAPDAALSEFTATVCPCTIAPTPLFYRSLSLRSFIAAVMSLFLRARRRRDAERPRRRGRGHAAGR